MNYQSQYSEVFSYHLDEEEQINVLCGVKEEGSDLQKQVIVTGKSIPALQQHCYLTYILSTTTECLLGDDSDMKVN